MSCARHMISFARHMISCARHIISCARHIISCARHNISCARLIISCALHTHATPNRWDMGHWRGLATFLLDADVWQGNSHWGINYLERLRSQFKNSCVNIIIEELNCRILVHEEISSNRSSLCIHLMQFTNCITHFKLYLMIIVGKYR